MIDIAEFAPLAQVATQKTVTLSGESVAVFRSALAYLMEIHNWTWPNTLTDAEAIDYIQQLTDLASFELTQETAVMTEQRQSYVEVMHYNSDHLGHTPEIIFVTGHVHGHITHHLTPVEWQGFNSPFFSLRPGLYEFGILAVKTPGSGKAGFYFTSGYFEMDLYAATQQTNVRLVHDVTIPDEETSFFTCLAAGKNAASSGFDLRITSYWLRQKS